MQAETRRNDAVKMPWAQLRLPPFPQVAIRVLQLINNEHVQLNQLCDLISTDPAFASEVLTIANSAFYSPRYPASTVLQAIAVLGASHLQGMCLTVGVRAYLGKSLRHPSMQNLWRHNLACARIAEQIAAIGSIDKNTAYTCGILHDIGRFALAVIQPKEFAALLETHQGTSSSVLQCERELFGWDHCETGHQLISNWKLPSGFAAIVSDHHSATRQDGIWDMAELIKVSCRMADAAGFPAFPRCEVTPFSDLLDELPSHERSHFHSDVESLALEVTNSIHAIESV